MLKVKTYINNTFPYFAFLRYCIEENGNMDKVIAGIDWQDLYSFASNQAILGLCFDGIERLGKEYPEELELNPIGRELLMTWMGNTQLSVANPIIAYGYMMVVNLALGTFATFAFVIHLRKLNSFYLQIPILLNLMVYFYAISQMFGPLTMLADASSFFKIQSCDSTLLYSLLTETNYQFEKINIAFLFASLFGKLCLAMVMYWIVYKFRFIYFVITKSLSLTETPEKIKVFWRYIGEKGE